MIRDFDDLVPPVDLIDAMEHHIQTSDGLDWTDDVEFEAWLEDAMTQSLGWTEL
jgi:hypothetical protein